MLSPVSLGALWHATRAAVAARNEDPLAGLRALLARAYGADGVALTASGTHALQLALRAATAATGSAGSAVVALPAFCCYDVASAAVGVRARIALYDLDPATLAPDAASLERAFRAGARVAVVAPLFGVPVPWEPLESLAVEYGAVLIEDAAQGHAARWRGAPLGSLGRLSVLSFGRGKGWTGGGGGALLWRRSNFSVPVGELAAPPVLSGARALVGGLAQWLLARPELYALPAAVPALGLGLTHYHAPTPAAAMPATVAALVLMTHATAAAEGEARRCRGAALHSAVAGLIRHVDVPDGAEPGYLRLPVRLVGARSTARAVRALRHLGAAATYPTTLDEVPAVRNRLVPWGGSFWPGAAMLVRELFTLPTHRFVTAEDVAAIEAGLRTHP